MEKLAIFDLDYTLTKMETQVEFLRFFLQKYPSKAYTVLRSVGAFAGYALKIHSAGRSKEINNKYLEGITLEELDKLSEEFFKTKLKKILYIDGVKMVKKLHDEGFVIIISSASPEFYVKEFEKSPIIEKSFGTRFESLDGKFISKLYGENNKGEEKVRRLMEYLGTREIDWDSSLMFSDSLSDKPLLDKVGKGYLINYKKYAEYEILNWR